MAGDNLLYLCWRVLNNNYIFSHLKLQFYGLQQYSPYGATLSADKYCLTRFPFIEYEIGYEKFKSPFLNSPLLPDIWCGAHEYSHYAI